MFAYWLKNLLPTSAPIFFIIIGLARRFSTRNLVYCEEKFCEIFEYSLLTMESLKTAISYRSDCSFNLKTFSAVLELNLVLGISL